MILLNHNSRAFRNGLTEKRKPWSKRKEKHQEKWHCKFLLLFQFGIYNNDKMWKMFCKCRQETHLCMFGSWRNTNTFFFSVEFTSKDRCNLGTIFNLFRSFPFFLSVFLAIFRFCYKLNTQKIGRKGKDQTVFILIEVLDYPL